MPHGKSYYQNIYTKIFTTKIFLGGIMISNSSKSILSHFLWKKWLLDSQPHILSSDQTFDKFFFICDVILNSLVGTFSRKRYRDSLQFYPYVVCWAKIKMPLFFSLSALQLFPHIHSIILLRFFICTENTFLCLNILLNISKYNAYG